VRGDIYRFKSNDRRGRKQSGSRYAVVLQSDDLAALSTALVAPTSLSARAAMFRPEIQLDGQSTRVLLEQLTVVDPQTELGDFAGCLNAAELHNVNAALKLVLDL
jgi:mRNA interferase MazF